MDLHDFYPLPGDLVKSELEVLNFLRNDPYIKERHSTLAQDAGIYFGRNKNTLSFEFFSYIDVSHGMRRGAPKAKPNLRLIIAAQIERHGPSYENITYCLSVCRTRT